MRFIADGPSIPDALPKSRDAGVLRSLLERELLTAA
jgi:hypothetical protein